MREFVVSLAVGAVLVPLGVLLFKRNGWNRENWRGARLAFPAGILIVVSAAVALIGLGGLERTNFGRTILGVSPILWLVFGVALLGFIDDVVDAAPRGLRGHGSALLRGQVSTGVLKAGGTVLLSLLVVWPNSLSDLVTVGVIVLATNLFNLLDLRPGRAFKGFLILGATVAIATGTLAVFKEIGIFIGPLVVVGLFDLRERAMMGDTGANLLGVVAGIWLVLALSTTGQIVALVVLLALTLFGEFRSFSAAIESNALLKWIDQVGRIRVVQTQSPAGGRRLQ